MIRIIVRVVAVLIILCTALALPSFAYALMGWRIEDTLTFRPAANFTASVKRSFLLQF